MIPSFGATEVLILLVVVLLLFGAKRIPDLARSLGSGAREFRKGILDKEDNGQEATGPRGERGSIHRGRGARRSQRRGRLR